MTCVLHVQLDPIAFGVFVYERCLTPLAKVCGCVVVMLECADWAL